MEMNIMLAGFGGQGILFAGKLIAYAGLLDGRELSWLPSYGPEMRGGTANCSVCLSDEPIGSPLVTAPDALLAMNVPSFDRFINDVVPSGVVIVDKTMANVCPTRADIRFCGVPATQLAEENGLKGLANVILVGTLLKMTGFSTIETLNAAIDKSVPPRKQELVASNKKALAIGFDFVPADDCLATSA
ncbi:MAG: 2-oxoacid:acceptor oxidoreductase family protein [Coriobacteriales bacterium]|jgi:2-oxoglutarate ferredoxin oxidoreductase subunit gamma|nr:2-oxoacid:acceptor oxidoreductase family protein [Coriobacteriales bacterium]